MAIKLDAYSISDADTTLKHNALVEQCTKAFAALSLLNEILTVAGTGSLLDADLLDGQEGSYYELAAIDSWTNATYENSWVSYSVNFPDAGYYLDRGRVYLQGRVKTGTMDAAIFTLPAGYRPSRILLFGVESNAAYGRCSINPDGTVVASVGSNVAFNLDGISFRI